MKKTGKKIGIIILLLAATFLLGMAAGAFLLRGKSAGEGATTQEAEVSRSAETPGAGDSAGEADQNEASSDESEDEPPVFSIDLVPPYAGEPSVKINGNIPYFTKADLTTDTFETYGELDDLGRCTAAFACIDKGMMPTEERGAIGAIEPTGWQLVKYDFLKDMFLYNRCHLIGWQLTGQNANEKNLITGTRYMNVEGMLPYENAVAVFLSETNAHVLYRVTSVFEGKNLLASGVLMEAYSVEDHGQGLSFCVFCYNAQPGIIIDYANGENHIDENADLAALYGTNENAKEEEDLDDAGDRNLAVPAEEVEIPEGTTYVLNANTRKFHRPDCDSVKEMKEKNRVFSEQTREEIIEAGYAPCGACKP